MGALDDAIREHLELKRRHGAPTQEVARKEKEALEQGALPSDSAVPGELGSGQAPLGDGASEGLELEPESAAEVSEAAPGLAPDEELDVGSMPEPPPAVGFADELEPDEVLPEEALELDATSPEEEDSAPLEPEAALEGEQSSWEPADAPDGSGDAEDLLEETPDFLEDVPEQDRLWFDQRPPKDFDFGD
jgi:hypothetical protein